MTAPLPGAGYSWQLRLVALLLALVPVTGLVVMSDVRTGHAFVAGDLLDKTIPASRTVAKGASWLPGVGWAIKGGLLAWSLYDLYKEWSDFTDPRDPSTTSPPSTTQGGGCPTGWDGCKSQGNTLVFDPAWTPGPASATWTTPFPVISNYTAAQYLFVRSECVRASDGSRYTVNERPGTIGANGGTAAPPSFCAQNDTPMVVELWTAEDFMFSTTKPTSNSVIWKGAMPLDPNRTVRSYAYCRDSSGTVTKVIGTSADYTLGSTQPIIPSVTCPAGASIVGKGLEGGAVGQAPETIVEVLPDGNVSPAPLELLIDGAPCVAGDPRCTSTNLDTLYRTQPDRLLCRWGGMTVPLSDCGFLAEPGTEVYNPPVTSPNPSPSPAPADSGFPTTGVSPNPNDGTNCIDGIWSWNPVHWVYVPVKCALLWAFSPDMVQVQPRLDAVKTKLGNVPPFSWALDFAGWGVGLVPGDGGCPDWRVKVAGNEQQVMCGHSFTDALVAMRPVFTVMMAATAIAPLLRSVFYATFPLIKPAPTEGGPR